MHVSCCIFEYDFLFMCLLILRGLVQHKNNANAHAALDKKQKRVNHRKQHSIIYDLFQGKMVVTSLKRNKSTEGADLSAASTANLEAEPESQFEETSSTMPFSVLSLKIPEVPLFKDSEGGLVIPQVPLMELLKKYDGQTWTTVGDGGESGGVSRRKYAIQHLPQYLIIHLMR